MVRITIQALGVPIKFGQAALESSVHLEAPQDRKLCWWLPLVQGVVVPTRLLQRADGSNGTHVISNNASDIIEGGTSR